ncbi:MAG: hypothetical protein AAF666_00440 [Pseudomonadota bacterium]
MVGVSTQSELVILNLIPNNRGWQPITHLVKMMHEIFGARVITPGPERASLPVRLGFRVLSRRRAEGAPSLLIIAPKADKIRRFRELPEWRNTYRTVAAWVIDSFHSENLSASDGFRHLDKLFVTWGGNIPEYQAMTNGPVIWLPWGTDALRLGHVEDSRRWDLLRFGRQPASWEDDDATSAQLAAHGLSFQGRPDENTYDGLLSRYLAQSKFILAHSNLADGSSYTHSTREYFTARWVDAFACGAGVIGVQPKSDPLFETILPEAIVNLATTDRDAELPRIRQDIQDWTPERAIRIRNMALHDFDWRWRLKDVARELDLPTERLNAELAEIQLLLDQDAQRFSPKTSNSMQNAGF